MNEPTFQFTINRNRIDKNHCFQGKNGLYVTGRAYPNKNGPDQNGNTHFVVQSVSKEAYERGEKGPIIGNGRIIEPRHQS
jgi:hypothetical protein